MNDIEGNEPQIMKDFSGPKKDPDSVESKKAALEDRIMRRLHQRANEEEEGEGVSFEDFREANIEHLQALMAGERGPEFKKKFKEGEDQGLQDIEFALKQLRDAEGEAGDDVDVEADPDMESVDE